MTAHKDNKKFYNGIKGVRNAGFEQALTLDQIKEIIKCVADPIYFIESYIKIVSKSDVRFDTEQKKKSKKKGLILFELRSYQKKLVLLYMENPRLIVMFPRQSGKSATIQAICVYLAVFNEFRYIAVLSNKQKTSTSFLSKIKLMIKHLPFFMQPGVLEWNKTSIQFDNNSNITSAATSADGIRGETCTDLIVDEQAFIKNNIWKEFYSSIYPVVSADEEAKITFISTPNGYNHFKKFWDDAIDQRSTYIPMRIYTSDIPGRDAQWVIDTKKDVGEVIYAQEYDCEFTGSGGALISANGLNGLTIYNPIEYRDDDNFKIYEYPKKNNTYVLIADVGEGVGLDSSTCQIINITEETWVQSAVYENNKIQTDNFPAVIERFALMYNDALVIGENNFCPEVLSNLITDFDYDNVFYDITEDKNRYGLRTTTKTKKVGCAYLKRNIEENRLVLLDEMTIFQLSVFVKKGNSFAADSDYHDDCVSPLILFSYFMRRTDWIEEWCNLDINIDYDARRKLLRDKIEEDMMPAGFVNRGTGVVNLESPTLTKKMKTNY